MYIATPVYIEKAQKLLGILLKIHMNLDQMDSQPFEYWTAANSAF